ncbi:hypothetical protein VMCG_04891 [Cytospora schulzeri]|uniref:FAD-binding PCMH-type domain-containing protein n=1 Tax=Cytospora schulzeri TaxID=448051 RepID=A0A423WMW7_9PEZI|nr:hypothetical protein VMCG_04891 [Valsa malicola]
MVTEHGFVNGMVKATHPTMSNGPALDALNDKVFEVFDKALEDSPTTVTMYEWIGKLIMRGTTDAIYGPSNPMRNSRMLEAWHTYHPALMYIMLDILPQNVFFKAAVKGREELVQSFAEYYTEGRYKQGSAYIQEFTEHCINQKIPEGDIPRFLLGTLFNNVANTIPSAFWVIYRIFSDPIVLEDCRNEVNRAVEHHPDGTSTIDLDFIPNSCPILLSTYEEVFRFHGLANSVRVVSEDHMLDNKYLVKKGGLIMMSARAQHSNPAVWGENVDEFYHKRFLKQQPGTGKRLNPVAFRGFGGGATLCPGRHFATSEILLLVTMLLLRFDVRPANKMPWVLPSTAKSSEAEAVEQPDDDIEVELVPRPEARGRKWGVTFSGRRDAELLVQKSLISVALCAATVSATAGFEGRRYDYDTPSTPITTFSANYTTTADALEALSLALSPNASLAAPLTVPYGSTIGRVWPKQLETWPEAIVYPNTPEDVSIIMQFYSKYHALWEDGFAIMCGGHFSSGGAQSSSLIVDLQNLNNVIINDPVDDQEPAILKVGGGTKSGHVYDVLDGTGWAFLGARSTTIGTGGFTLGGGIAYQAGRYGIGADSLVGVEVVLVNGTIIYANPYNEYSDIFWATTGGGWAANIGVVTNFYSRAYPDPGQVQVGTFVYSESKKDKVFPRANDFWENNTDPDAMNALVYYFKDPDYPSAVAPITEREFVLQVNAMYFGSMEGFNASYAPFYEDVNYVSVSTYTLKDLKEFLSSNYMFPDWNKAGPASDSATAWPHSTSAHITLSSLMWSNQSNAAYVDERDSVMMDYLRSYQESLNAPAIYDYPNYLAPYSKPEEVWGVDNFNRLVAIKEKYDPQCLMSRGVVISTKACSGLSADIRDRVCSQPLIHSIS